MTSTLRVYAFLATVVWCAYGEATKEYATDRVLVRFKPGAVAPQTNSELGLTLSKRVGNMQTTVYKLKEGGSVDAVVEELQNMEGVESASPDYILRPLAIEPDDPYFYNQWHQEKINATNAWAISTGSSEVKVCIIDTGIQWDHPDLKPNFVKGFSTIDGEEPDNCYDTDGHGTHVAGIVAAAGNNGIGGTGIAWKASLVGCRFMGNDGGYTSDAIECLDKCREEGALISTHSYGSYWNWDYFKSELARGADDGTQHLVVAAAGNDAWNSDVYGSYPAGYDLDNIISVGSSGTRDTMSTFSNFGKVSVDLFAPGSQIMSTYPTSTYTYLSGTSMATPVVAGAAAVLQAAAQARGVTLSNTQMKKYLMEGVDKLSPFKDMCVTGGRLNLEASLNLMIADVGGGGGGSNGEIKAHTLKQRVFARVKHGCGVWQEKSQSAYTAAMSSMLGVNDVKMSCEEAGNRKLSITMMGTTSPMNLDAAQLLSQQLHKAIKDEKFQEQVLSESSNAHAPYRAGPYCISGVTKC